MGKPLCPHVGDNTARCAHARCQMGHCFQLFKWRLMFDVYSRASLCPPVRGAWVYFRVVGVLWSGAAWGLGLGLAGGGWRWPVAGGVSCFVFGFEAHQMSNVGCACACAVVGSVGSGQARGPRRPRPGPGPGHLPPRLSLALCCAGKLLTGNIGSLCEQQPLKVLRAPCGPIPQYKMLYYFFPSLAYLALALGPRPRRARAVVAASQPRPRGGSS
jgi:hypothetical protein